MQTNTDRKLQHGQKAPMDHEATMGYEATDEKDAPSSMYACTKPSFVRSRWRRTLSVVAAVVVVVVALAAASGAPAPPAVFKSSWTSPGNDGDVHRRGGATRKEIVSSGCW